LTRLSFIYIFAEKNKNKKTNKRMENLFFNLAEIEENLVEKMANRVIEKLSEVEPKKKMYTRNEVADMLSITLVTLSKLTKNGTLKARKIGGRVLYPADAIDTIVTSRTNVKYLR
jgi:excisionase family DNA binding protein